MDNSLISLIAGGGIAIASGILVQIVSSILNSKNEKKKFVFNKLEDIIDSISRIEQGMQIDAAQVYGVGDPSNSSKGINLSFEQNKLECLIKIYHPRLSTRFDNLRDIVEEYHRTKREIINLKRQGNNDMNLETLKLEELGKNFEKFGKETKLFISELTKYGNRKVN